MRSAPTMWLNIELEMRTSFDADHAAICICIMMGCRTLRDAPSMCTMCLVDAPQMTTASSDASCMFSTRAACSSNSHNRPKAEMGQGCSVQSALHVTLPCAVDESETERMQAQHPSKHEVPAPRLACMAVAECGPRYAAESCALEPCSTHLQQGRALPAAATLPALACSALHLLLHPSLKHRLLQCTCLN